jgi:iron complex transport system ATP-binding protein
VLLRGTGIGWRVGGRAILGPLDLEIQRGESLGVVGPNGAGKTTLLRIVAGLLPPSSGELSYEGRPYASLSRRAVARRIAYVPQIRPARIPLTVFEVVLLGRYPHLSRLQLAPRAEDYAATEEALHWVGIDELRDRPVDELSGGERQAVFIAAALAQDAEVLVLDEPSLHLDARHLRELAALLLRLRSSAQRTIVMASHDLNLAALVGDRLLALDAGQALALGPPAEILVPAVLERVFRAPFEIVESGAHPVAMLHLGP